MSVEGLICSSCGGAVSASDSACRHCGTLFQTVIRPKGSLPNAMFRAFLVAWSLSLPVLCLWLTLTAPNHWGAVLAWLTNQFYFVPWITVLITLAVLTWATEERR
jgi:ribosomal protein L40E